MSSSNDIICYISLEEEEKATFEENTQIIAVVLGILQLVSIVFFVALVLKGKRDKVRAEKKAEER